MTQQTLDNISLLLQRHGIVNIPNTDDIRVYFEGTGERNLEICDKILRRVESCEDDEINFSIQNLVSMALNFFHSPIVQTSIKIITLIGKVLGWINGQKIKNPKPVFLEVHWFEKSTKIKEDINKFWLRFSVRKRRLDQFHKDGEITAQEALNLLDDVRYTELGFSLLGTLEANITLNKSIRDPETLKLVGEMLNVYVRVAFMRLSVVLQIFSIMQGTLYDNESLITRSLQHTKEFLEEEIKDRVDFVTGVLEPRYENAAFLSFFEITKFPDVKKYLNEKSNEENVQLCLKEHSIHFADKLLAFQPQAYQLYWMNVSSYCGFVWSTFHKPRFDYAQFTFETFSKEDNLFFIRLFKKTGGQAYLYMKPGSFLSTKKSKPDKDGLFKVILLKNCNCLLSVAKWPGKFIYMERYFLGRIKGGESNSSYDVDGFPSAQHEWSIKEVWHDKNRRKDVLVENPQFENLFSYVTL